LFGGRFIRFFINGGPIIEAGTAMMHTFVWELAFAGSQITLQIALMIIFQSFGRAIQAMAITLGRQFLFYIPLLYLLNYLFVFNGFIRVEGFNKNPLTGSRGSFRALKKGINPE
jgi:Na+-driven multidrug efflux pump